MRCLMRGLDQNTEATDPSETSMRADFQRPSLVIGATTKKICCHYSRAQETTMPSTQDHIFLNNIRGYFGMVSGSVSPSVCSVCVTLSQVPGLSQVTMLHHMLQLTLLQSKLSPSRLCLDGVTFTFNFRDQLIHRNESNNCDTTKF